MTVIVRPVAVSTALMLPAFSVTMRTCVPGTKAAAQGSSKLAMFCTANGPTVSPGAVVVGVEEVGFGAFSPDEALPQLEAARATLIDRAADIRRFLVMLAAIPFAEFVNDCPPGALVVGVDEAGRGPLAGPVVASAVASCKPRPAGLDDSKKLTANKRSTLDLQVRRRCAWGVAVIEPAEIDRLNIFHATMRAMTLAVARLVETLGCEPETVLIDGNMTPHGRQSDWRWADARAIVGGDAKEPAISAASIVAKEWRDRLMIAAAHEHPHYGWERNKGYGTAEHLDALRRHGPCALHRRSFAPVAQQEMFA